MKYPFQFPFFLDMPFIEDWITHPMTIINRLHGKILTAFFQKDFLEFSLEKSPNTFENDVRNYFQTNINHPDLYKEIPSLNDNPSLPSGCLVRFRAMIQDMTDDEIYCSKSSMIFHWKKNDRNRL